MGFGLGLGLGVGVGLGLVAACGPEGVAGHRLGGGDEEILRVIAEDLGLG